MFDMLGYYTVPFLKIDTGYILDNILLLMLNISLSEMYTGQKSFTLFHLIWISRKLNNFSAK